MMEPVETVCEQGELAIKLHEDRVSAIIYWLGQSNSRNPSEFLNPLISKLTTRLRGKKVTLDFRRLEYMNSATVSPMMNLIRSLDEAGIDTLVLYDDTIDWQRVNFRCVRTIATRLKHITVKT